ncbi:MAG: serine/threonine-protein kinase [Pseudomonadota bacterium]
MDRWERIQTLFHEASEKPFAEREAYIDAHCGDDEGLRQELLALLSNAQAETFSPHIAESASAYLEQLDEAMTGTQVGAYRLLEVIGTGGMGTVFAAERADGAFERRVAVKVVKKGMDSEAIVQRFERERQILARLSHPNVAGLLDGGLMADGRPYFVTELVQGEPIVAYCDRHRLTVPERLRLFQTVCRVVHYAHQNLVVHRDLKPSNILVDESGAVKLLDFGIAKTLDAGQDESLTQTSSALFTPAYAAPEQLLGEHISTGTDVYALGVVLYELLTGQRPFETVKTNAQLRAEIISGDPQRPSTALTRSLANRAQLTQEMAQARQLDTRGLRQLLRGDLDGICLTALRRERALRYGSAEALAADLERHLTQQPVSARPPTWGYRAQTFVRRHRGKLAMGMAVVVSIFAMATYYTMALAQQRDVALAEQAKAEQVVQFVIGLFERSDPSNARGEEVTAREILDAGHQQIETELQSQPEVRAKLKQVLGGVYFSLGSVPRASELLQASLNEQLALQSSELEIAETRLSLGFAREFDGQYAAARELYEASYDARARLLPPGAPQVTEALAAIAFLNQTEGRFDDAKVLFEQALLLARNRAGVADDEAVAKHLNQLAEINRLLDLPYEAEPLLIDSLAMQERIYGGTHPESADTKRMLAGVYRDTERYDVAERLYKEVIDERTRMLGEDHREVLNTWNSYSQLLGLKGDHDGMLAANFRLIQSLERLSEARGELDVSLPAIYHNRAYTLKQLGRQAEAIEYFSKSMEMQDAIGLAADHPNRAYPMASIGQSYRLLGDKQQAVEWGLRAITLRRQHYAEDHRLIAEVKSDLGTVYRELGEYAVAEGYLLDAYAHTRARKGEDFHQTKVGRNNLRLLYEAWGRLDEAAKYSVVPE